MYEIPKDKQIGQMTYHTLRHIFYNKVLLKQMQQTKSPDEVKRVLWETNKPWLTSDKSRLSFIKGAKLIDFAAIFSVFEGERAKSSTPPLILHSDVLSSGGSAPHQEETPTAMQNVTD